MCVNVPRHRHLPPATWRVRTGRAVRFYVILPRRSWSCSESSKRKRKKTPAKTLCRRKHLRMYPGQKPVFSNGIRFREGWAAVHDDERSGRPSTSHTGAMVKNVLDGVNCDRRLGIRA